VGQKVGQKQGGSRNRLFYFSN